MRGPDWSVAQVYDVGAFNGMGPGGAGRARGPLCRTGDGDREAHECVCRVVTCY